MVPRLDAPPVAAAPDQVRATVRPYVVVRVAALPTSTVTALRSAALDAALRDLAARDEAHNAARDAVSRAMHDAIGRVPDRRVRGRLLQLRRGLYRGDAPANALLAAVAALPPATASAVRAAADVLGARAAAQSAFRAVHAAALAEARSRFQQALADGDFQKGLLLSSSTLHGNLARYRAATPGTLTSRDEQVERGLLRYFTRAVMKATPFARLCAVGAGALVDPDGVAPGLAFDADPSAKRGHVRLNKKLYGIVWNHLKTRPTVRRALVVGLNPTLDTNGDRLHFLAAVDGREVFQRVRRVEALDAVVAYVRANHDITHGELAAAIAANPRIEATREEASAYLDALVGHGLLRFRSFVREQVADWAAPLGAALTSVADAHAQRLAALLGEVRVIAECYADADVAERRTLAECARGAVSSALDDLGLTARLPRDLPFYEDASTSALLRVPRTTANAGALARLGEWVALTQPLAHPNAEQATMRHFFDSRYGPNARVPLLQFYEEFYRDHFRRHLDKQSAGRPRPADPRIRGYDFGNPFGLARVHQLRDASGRLTELVRARWAAAPDADVLEIKPNEVRAALGALADEPRRAGHSASAFGQLVPAGPGRPDGAIVVPHGQYFVGFGKYFSRFLYMLPEAMQECVLADNAALAGGAVLAEICGDAHFNANLHPPLLPCEISYPTGESASDDGQLPSAVLDVCADISVEHALQIVDRRTGQRVLPVDLGFLNPQMRPPLYQLLSHFTPGGSFGLALPESPTTPRASPGGHTELHGPVPAGSVNLTLTVSTDPTTDCGGTSSGDVLPDGRVGRETTGGAFARGVIRRPRIVFDGCLVLARRRWTVPGALVPRQAAAEDDGDYMVRVDRWRRAHMLPTEMYVRVIPEPAPRRPGLAPQEASPVGAASESAAQPAARDWVADSEDRAQSVTGHAPDEGVNEEDVATSPEHASIHREGASHAGSAAGTSGQPPSRPWRDWQKPQYVDIANPLCVRLFSRIAGDLTAFRLYVEECYPGTDALPSFEGQTYVAELVLQVDVPPTASAACGRSPATLRQTVVAGG